MKLAKKKKARKRPTLDSLMERLLKFNLTAAEAALLAKEKVDGLDPSEEEGEFHIQEYNRMINILKEILAIRGGLKSVGLGAYAPYATRMILRSHFGPKMINMTVQK